MFLWRGRYGVIALLIVWICVTYIVVFPLRCEQQDDLVERINKLTNNLEVVKRQYDQLLEQTKQLYGSGFNIKFDQLGGIEASGYSRAGPSEEYEMLRHRLYSDAEELWFFIEDQMKDLHKNPSADSIEKIAGQMRHRSISILSNIEQLPRVDKYMPWRIQEAARVSKLVQKRLYALQNPSHCKKVKKVGCNINKSCGFGCQLHHLVYCMIHGFAHEMPVVLISQPWRYDQRGWGGIFEGISDTCPKPGDNKLARDSKTSPLQTIDVLTVKPRYLPLAIPKDLAHRILRFNGDPAAWWIGQIIKFVFRPKKQFHELLRKKMAEIGFAEPIVGVHIRRTDKIGTEAAFHHISEYMKHVDTFYDKLELTKKVDKRRVYLASDDPKVLQQARSLYSNYVFYGDPSISASADLRTRYNATSLTYLLLDMHILAACDYLVCTFSSQVGRIAYAMMQANRVDASHSFQSLDDIFYYGGQTSHDRVAIQRHKATRREEIEFEVGDRIGVAGNHWNGFGKGINKRTSQVGLFPYYKTMDQLEFYDFPKYVEEEPTNGEASQNNK